MPQGKREKFGGREKEKKEKKAGIKNYKTHIRSHSVIQNHSRKGNTTKKGGGKNNMIKENWGEEITPGRREVERVGPQYLFLHRKLLTT